MKAVIYNKDTLEISEIITNVTDYTDTKIYGDSRLEGLSTDCSFLLLDDAIEVSTIPEMLSQDLKPSLQDVINQKTYLINKFSEIWATYDLFLQHAYDSLKTAIIGYIQAGDYASLRLLATSSAVPAELQDAQRQLSNLLPQ